MKKSSSKATKYCQTFSKTIKTTVLALLFVATLSGCQNRLEAQFGPEILKCPEEPKPVNIQTEMQMIRWFEAVRVAGNQCRSNLKLIEKIITEQGAK